MFEIGRLTGLSLGREGESNARPIKINVSEWLTEWPGAKIGMLLLRPGETGFYAADIKVIDGVLHYTPKRADVEIHGDGRAQIVLTGAGDVELRSKVVETKIEASMPGSAAPVPEEPMQPFVNKVIDAASRAEEAAERAEEVAEGAGENAAPPILRSDEGAMVAIPDAAERKAVQVVSYIDAGRGPVEAVGLTRTGKNLVSHQNYTMTNGHKATVVTQDVIDVTSPDLYDYGNISVPVKAGVTYTLVIDWEVYGRDPDSTAETKCGYYLGPAGMTTTQVPTKANGVKRIVKTYSFDSDQTVRLSWCPNYVSALPARSRSSIMLLEGAYTADTAPAFEPGVKQTLTATLPETVYGGILDWTSGLLTITHDADGAELAEPRTRQLDPQTLEMLKGYNALWSDTGDTLVRYVADTKLYVDSKAGTGSGTGTGSGQDGFSPTVEVSKADKTTTLTITDATGTKTATINDGKDGKTPVKGTDYFDGQDGFSPTVEVSKADKTTTLTITDATGTKTATINDGKDGKTPVKGTDYFTAADKADMVNQVKAALPTLTLTGVDADGVTHTYTIYGS